MSLQRTHSLPFFCLLLCVAAPLRAQEAPEDRVGAQPRTMRSWNCRDLTPVRSGAHLRFEFRLSDGLGRPPANDTTLGPSLRAVEIAFDARGNVVQLRDRARLAGTTGQMLEIAGVRDASGALAAREWRPRSDGGVTVRDVEAVELSALVETVQAFWAMRCPSQAR